MEIISFQMARNAWMYLANSLSIAPREIWEGSEPLDVADPHAIIYPNETSFHIYKS